MKLFAIALVLVACREPIDIPSDEPPAATQPPPKPERKVILPEHGMVCEVLGAEPIAWWPDGRITRVERIGELVASRDGTVYKHDYATKGFVPIDTKGPDAVRVIAKGLESFTGIAIDSPTKMVAWTHGDKESLVELVKGAWKAETLPPRPANDTYSLAAVAYGPDGALWVLRHTGLFVRGPNGYEEIPLGEPTSYVRHHAMATAPDAAYVLSNSRFLRIDAARKVTVLAKWDEGTLSNGAVAVAKTGRVIAFGQRYKSSFLLALAPRDAKATRIDLPTIESLAAVDDAGRAWLRSRAELVVIDAENTQHVYPPGSLTVFPEENSNACTPLGGGFAKLPAATAKHTGTLELQFSGADNGEIELCAKPDGGRSPSPCDGAAERIAGKLDSAGRLKLTVPTGHWEVAIGLDGKWYVTDYRSIGYRTKNTSCDITADSSCTIEMRVDR